MINIQVQDYFGNPHDVSENTVIGLFSDSPAGRFDIRSGGIFNRSITSIIIPRGSNSVSFYYRDTIVGTPTLAAIKNHNGDWSQAIQRQTVRLGDPIY